MGLRISRTGVSPARSADQEEKLRGSACCDTTAPQLQVRDGVFFFFFLSVLASGTDCGIVLPHVPPFGELTVAPAGAANQRQLEMVATIEIRGERDLCGTCREHETCVSKVAISLGT
jgi:hypothetical protein